MSHYGIPTGRIIGKCLDCKNNDGAFEDEVCMNCKHNPWLNDNYEKEAEQP